MGPLATTLQRWRGPEFVRETVERKGYRAHLAELEFLRAEFGTAADDLPTYWNEVAKEIVFSVGLGDSRGIRRNEPGCYLSAYLNDQQRRFFEAHPEHVGAWRGFPRHEVYHLRNQIRGAEAAELNDRQWDAIDTAKAPEIVALLDKAWWDGERKRFPELVDETAKAAGFKPFSRRRSHRGYVQKGWDKTTADGLCFEIRADMGARYAVSGRLPSHRLGLSRSERNPRRYAQINWLPLMFSVRHVEEPDDDLYLGTYEITFPDLSIYRLFSTIEGGVLGVRALIAVLDAMSESFA